MININKSTETELKVMITKDEYNTFFSKAHNIYSQTNHYYKLNDNLCVRIRKINDRFFIQYKESNNTKELKALKDKTEYSMDISETDYIIINNNPNCLYDYLGLKNDSKIKAEYKGTLETIRGYVTLDLKMPDIQIDLNKYNSNVDYELEWEIEKIQYKKAINILKKNNVDINNRITGVSKLKRLLESGIC